jgi:molecular chaperone GrpE (heat shock protein)
MTTQTIDENTLPETPIEADKVDDIKIDSGDGDVLQKIVDLQASLARSQADYQNLVMRSERDKADMIQFLSAKIILPLLTQIDNLERAVKLKE